MSYFSPEIARVILLMGGLFGAAFLVAIIVCLYMLWKHFFKEH